MDFLPPHLIGLSGPAGCGKDTARGILERYHGYAGLAFADPMRDMVRALLESSGASDEWLTRRELKEQPVPGLGISTRHMMQTLGTELARQHWGEDFWLRMAAGRMAQVRSICYARPVRFVVSDVRFANEARWIREQGGVLWRIERPGLPTVRPHASEQQALAFDQVIDNSGTVRDLHRAIDAAISGEPAAQS